MLAIFVHLKAPTSVSVSVVGEHDYEEKNLEEYVLPEALSIYWSWWLVLWCVGMMFNPGRRKPGGLSGSGAWIWDERTKSWAVTWTGKKCGLGESVRCRAVCTVHCGNKEKWSWNFGYASGLLVSRNDTRCDDQTNLVGCTCRPSVPQRALVKRLSFFLTATVGFCMRFIMDINWAGYERWHVHNVIDKCTNVQMYSVVLVVVRMALYNTVLTVAHRSAAVLWLVWWGMINGCSLVNLKSRVLRSYIEKTRLGTRIIPQTRRCCPSKHSVAFHTLSSLWDTVRVIGRNHGYGCNYDRWLVLYSDGPTLKLYYSR